MDLVVTLIIIGLVNTQLVCSKVLTFREVSILGRAGVRLRLGVYLFVKAAEKQPKILADAKWFFIGEDWTD